jgi:glutathione-regulated potassium-efflux system ancillary protein KefF
MKQIISLFAHPQMRHSRVHKKLLQVQIDHPQVLVRDLYELYPDFIVNVESEQAIIKMADILIWQFPIHWYSMPSLLKEWIDSVFTPNFAFGPNGTELQGKYLWPVISCGGSIESYSKNGSNHHSLNTFLLPILQTAKYCGMNVFDPFIVYHANHISEEEIVKKTTQFNALIDELAFGNIFQLFQEDKE